MLVLRDRLITIPLMSLQTGTQVGVTREPIVDPRKLNIIAFYCEGPGIDFSPAVLFTSDIREYGSLGIIIDSAENIMPPDDLVRLREVLNFNFNLEDKPVITQNGTKLGKVATYTVDTQSYFIAKLHIKPTIWQRFSSAEFLIDRSQIKSVTDKQIIVATADSAHRKPVAERAAPVIDNPFRKPQHEAIKPNRKTT